MGKESRSLASLPVEKGGPLLGVVQVKAHEDWEVGRLDVHVDVVAADHCVNLLERAHWVSRSVHLQEGLRWAAPSRGCLLLLVEVAFAGARGPQLNAAPPVLTALLARSQHPFAEHVHRVSLRHRLAEDYERPELSALIEDASPLVFFSFVVVDEVEVIGKEDSMLLVVAATQIEELLAGSEKVRQVAEHAQILDEGAHGDKPGAVFDRIIVVDIDEGVPWRRDGRQVPGNEHRPSLSVLSEDHDPWILEFLHHLESQCVDPSCALLEEPLVLTTWVICLLVLCGELDGWVEGNRQIDVGGWLLVLELLGGFDLLHEVDLIPDDAVVGQE